MKVKSSSSFQDFDDGIFAEIPIDVKILLYLSRSLTCKIFLCDPGEKNLLGFGSIYLHKSSQRLEAVRG